MTAEPYKTVIGTEAGLRLGLSSGSCAQAAAAAALKALLTGRRQTEADIPLPPGKRRFGWKRVIVPVERCSLEGDTAEALVRKDAGDDTDITNGMLIGARVVLTEGGGISVDGGEGVGRITRPGVPGAVGEAAINPVPRMMIRRSAEELLPDGRGCRITVFVPEGEKAAGETWNPRIGITGGISIIGTKGVVEPRSAEAYKASIRRVIVSFRKNGIENIIITPGYVGESFLKNRGVSLERVVTAGDHIGFALDESVKRGAEGILLVGHVGKLTKLAAGIFNTHWRSGDGRLEVLAAYAAASGAGTETVRKILSSGTAEEAAGMLTERGLTEPFVRVCGRVIEKIRTRIGVELPVGCVLLNLTGEVLASVPEGIPDALEFGEAPCFM